MGLGFKMEWIIALLIATCMLSGCASTVEQSLDIKPPVEFVSGIQQKLEDLPKLDAPGMTIAVYEFKDLTGQRKPSQRFSQLSTAVTQGAETWVIDALQTAVGKVYIRTI